MYFTELVARCLCIAAGSPPEAQIDIPAVEAVEADEAAGSSAIPATPADSFIAWHRWVPQATRGIIAAYGVKGQRKLPDDYETMIYCKEAMLWMGFVDLDPPPASGQDPYASVR